MHDAAKSPHLQADLARLWPLIGRPIAFHRRLVDLTGSIKASLMLSQAIYWTRHGKDIRKHDGWFFKTMQQWHWETGLSRHEQVGARAKLRKLNVLQERIQKLPATLHFRVDGNALAALLSDRLGRRYASVAWDDDAGVAELLGPIVPFHRTLSTLTADVNAALFLSRALYRFRGIAAKSANGWFQASAQQCHAEVGLSRREQETARSALRRLAVLEEMHKGIPPRRWAKVDVTRVVELLTQPGGRRESLAAPLHKSGNQGCSSSSDSVGANRTPRMRHSHNQDWRKPAILITEERHHGSPVSANLYMNVITRTITTKPPPTHIANESSRRSLQDTRSSSELIYPNALLPEEKGAAEALVMRCPALAQELLDELAGRMGANAIRTSPIAYLRGMVNRAQKGNFVLELGVRVATSRRQSENGEVERQKQAAEDLQRRLERASPEYQAQLGKRRDEIRRMLDAVGRSSNGKKTP
jgi:hypothetical protein